MKKKYILLALLAFLPILSVNQVHAQSGEGVGICTYYYSNGFTSRTQCERWARWTYERSIPAWKRKLDNCMISTAIASTPAVFMEELAMSPKAVAVTYGVGVLSCMFGN